MIPKDIHEKRKDGALQFVSVDQDPFGFYRDHYVEFNHQSQTVCGGIYRGMTSHGKLVLAPHVEIIRLNVEEQRSYNLPYSLHWNEGVLLATAEMVITAQLRSKPYIEKLLKDYNLPAAPPLNWEI